MVDNLFIRFLGIGEDTENDKGVDHAHETDRSLLNIEGPENPFGNALFQNSGDRREVAVALVVNKLAEFALFLSQFVQHAHDHRAAFTHQRDVHANDCAQFIDSRGRAVGGRNNLRMNHRHIALEDRTKHIVLVLKVMVDGGLGQARFGG